jgi:trigger factor
MNITVTTGEKCKRELRLEIPGNTVIAETDRLAGDLARRVSVPGFRRGHVPRSVVKTRFKKELREEVLSHLLPQAFSDAIKEKELKVVGEPSLENLKFGDDESIDATFLVEIAPEFQLGNYERLPVTKRNFKVRDEDVDKVIARLSEQQAELVPVEDRASKAGDIVTVNLVGRIERAPGDSQEGADEPEEFKQEDVDISLTQNGAVKEFAEGLTGASLGETRTFSVDYPADHSSANLAGRRVTYTAEITSIKVKELPEIDDAFAHSVDEKFSALGELRDDFRSRLEKDAGHRSDEEVRKALMDQLVDRNRFDVPEIVVERHLDSRINSMLRRLVSQGIDPRKIKIDWDELRESQREAAEREVRGSFIVSRIAEAEGIEVSEEDLSGEIESIAEATGTAVATIRARLTKEDALDNIREQIRNRKALDHVIASAEIRNLDVEGPGDDESGGRE